MNLFFGLSSGKILGDQITVTEIGVDYLINFRVFHSSPSPCKNNYSAPLLHLVIPIRKLGEGVTPFTLRTGFRLFKISLPASSQMGKDGGIDYET
jgi:hypothetical protein